MSDNYKQATIELLRREIASYSRAISDLLIDAAHNDALRNRREMRRILERKLDAQKELRNLIHS